MCYFLWLTGPYFKNVPSKIINKSLHQVGTSRQVHMMHGQTYIKYVNNVCYGVLHTLVCYWLFGCDTHKWAGLPRHHPGITLGRGGGGRKIRPQSPRTVEEHLNPLKQEFLLTDT